MGKACTPSFNPPFLSPVLLPGVAYKASCVLTLNLSPLHAQNLLLIACTDSVNTDMHTAQHAMCHDTVYRADLNTSLGRIVALEELSIVSERLVKNDGFTQNQRAASIHSAMSHTGATHVVISRCMVSLDTMENILPCCKRLCQ